MKPELSRSWAVRYFRRPPHDIPGREQRPAGGGQMRFGRAADVEVQPSTNGHPRVRLRSPEEIPAARPQVWRRLTQPLPLIGVVLVLVALAGYWSVYSATTKRTPVIVAAHNLQAGAVLRSSDLRTAELAGEAGGMAELVPERELETVLGRELAAPVAQGAPLPRASVAAGGAEPAAFTLVVPALRAVGSSLRPGDRVTVLATFESGTGAQARAIARACAPVPLSNVARTVTRSPGRSELPTARSAGTTSVKAAGSAPPAATEARGSGAPCATGAASSLPSTVSSSRSGTSSAIPPASPASSAVRRSDERRTAPAWRLCAATTTGVLLVVALYTDQ